METMQNLFGLLYDLFFEIIKWCESLYDFLTSEVDILGYTFTPLTISGAFLVGILVIKITTT